MKRGDKGCESYHRVKESDVGVIVMSTGVGFSVFVFALYVLVTDLTWIVFLYILCHCAALICALCAMRLHNCRPPAICTLLSASMSVAFSILVCAGLIFRLGAWMALCFIPTVVLCTGAVVVILNTRSRIN